MSALTDFLNGRGVDGAGRRLAEVVGFDDRAIEDRHDFIQWLFPLQAESSALPNAPVLTDAEVDLIRGDPAAQANLAAGTERMLGFYRRTQAWLQPFDHNHLRITRIIRSLRLLVGDQAAEGFHTQVLALAGDRPLINRRSLQFWSTA